MARAALALGALLFAAGAAAQLSVPERSGYAFDNPRVLAQQRLFSLAHGTTLLAVACRRIADAAADEAYAAWRARQGKAIAVAAADLSAYYFGSGIADWQSLAEKLSLRSDLQALDAAELKAACATLPEALSRPRFDLAARLRLEEQMARTVAAAEAEARHAHCSKTLDGDERGEHEARYLLWREVNDPLARAAADALEREWPVDAPAASYSEWIVALKKETRARGDRAACLEFSAALKRPDSFLRNVFRVPPRPSDSK